MIIDRILAQIALHSKNDPVMSVDLEKQFNIPGPTLRKYIHKLRMKPYHKAIGITETGGYFLARTREEYEFTLRSLESRIKSLKDVHKDVEHTYLGLPGF